MRVSLTRKSKETSMKNRQSSVVPHRTKGIVRLMRRLRGARLWIGRKTEDLESWSKVEGYRDLTQEQLGTIEPKIRHRDLWPLC